MPDLTTDAQNPQSNPAAVAASDNLHSELHTVTVYGITNRHLSKDGKSFEDGGLTAKKDEGIHYYKETVTVAGQSSVGDFQATGPGNIEVIDKADFDRQTGAAVKSLGNKLGIYLHGIRNATGSPGEKAAELSADSGETFVAEDWASTAPIQSSSLLGNGFNILQQTNADYQSSADSQGMINKTAEELIDRFGANNVDLVAHSRGSVNEVRLLADLQAKDKAPVHSATLAHSDIDVGDFAHSLPDIYKASQHINVLYNPDDIALGMSAAGQRGEAKLPDGCTITDSKRLGSVGLGDQYLQNQAAQLVGKGYFLSMKDVPSSSEDSYGHTMGSKAVADLLTIPDIYSSNRNQLKDGPKYAAIAAKDCPVILTATTGGERCQDSPQQIVIPQSIVERDFVSSSPEVCQARSERLSDHSGARWSSFDNVWASNDQPPPRQ